MSEKLDNLLKMDKIELNKRLKEVYQMQKFTKTQSRIARAMEILLWLLIIPSQEEILFIILPIISLLYAIYRFIKPRVDDELIMEYFEQIADGIDNFKKYRSGELGVHIDEKLVVNTEKCIGKYLPYLLKTNIIYKISAFLPLINLRMDETRLYTKADHSPLFSLFNGDITGKNGIDMFLSKNLGKLNK